MRLGWPVSSRVLSHTSLSSRAGITYAHCCAWISYGSIDLNSGAHVVQPDLYPLRHLPSSSYLPMICMCVCGGAFVQVLCMWLHMFTCLVTSKLCVCYVSSYVSICWYVSMCASGLCTLEVTQSHRTLMHCRLGGHE